MAAARWGGTPRRASRARAARPTRGPVLTDLEATRVGRGPGAAIGTPRHSPFRQPADLIHPIPPSPATTAARGSRVGLRIRPRGNRERRRGRRRGGGGVQGVGGDSEVGPAAGSEGGGEMGPPRSNGRPAPGYMCPPAIALRALFARADQKWPAAELFCTRNRCTQISEPRLFGGYMREGSQKTDLKMGLITID